MKDKYAVFEIDVIGRMEYQDMMYYNYIFITKKK